MCAWKTGLMISMDESLCQSRHVVSMVIMVTPYWHMVNIELDLLVLI